MTEEDKIKNELKRLDYWTRDEPSKAPTRRVLRPEENEDDVIVTEFIDFIIE